VWKITSELSMYRLAGMAELADAEDLKSSALKRLVGSRPSPGTSKLESKLAVRELFLAAFFIVLFSIFVRPVLDLLLDPDVFS
jgi:hypothetical protein